jgi:integrase
MASISFDASTGWWSIRYYAGPDVGRIKRSLCRHPGAWSKSKPPRRPPEVVKTLAEPHEELERQAKLSRRNVVARETDLGRYFATYVTKYRQTRRPNSVRALVVATDKFAAWCRGQKVAHVEAVTVQRCDEWIAHRLAEGAKRSTVVTERGFLAPIWAQARRHRLIVENPWELALVPGKPKDEELKYWTVDELKLLFRACEGWLRDFAIVMANTGLRVGALTGLTWKDVDFEDGKIVLPAELSKSGKSYTIPLTPSAAAALGQRWLQAKSKSKNVLIFAGTVHGRRLERAHIWRRLRVAVKRAGIRDFGHYNHALRHSFAVALVGADVSMRLIQELLGHGSIKTTEIYAKVAPQKAKAVMDQFDITPPESPPESRPASGSETGPAPATSRAGGNAGRRPRGSRSGSPSE